MPFTGIVMALVPEARQFGVSPIRTGENLILSPDLRCRISGQGPARAAQAAQALVDAGADALISAGTAGGLDPDIRPGDLLLPERVLDPGGLRFEVHRAWHDRARTLLAAPPARRHDAPLLSRAGVIGGTAEKTTTFATTGACAVDLESAAVLSVAARHELPALVIRVVVDSAAMPIPEFVIACSDAYGRVRGMALAAALLRRPHESIALLRLARAWGAARRTLRWLAMRRNDLAWISVAH